MTSNHATTRCPFPHNYVVDLHDGLPRLHRVRELLQVGGQQREALHKELGAQLREGQLELQRGVEPILHAGLVPGQLVEGDLRRLLGGRILVAGLVPAIPDVKLARRSPRTDAGGRKPRRGRPSVQTRNSRWGPTPRHDVAAAVAHLVAVQGGLVGLADDTQDGLASAAVILGRIAHHLVLPRILQILIIAVPPGPHVPPPKL
mmetsp:Transcript_135009/g.419547  ORF Transcript_135009/g.419547 Transcript_135009/m.419547 type:complete len:203 (-) Transcript_135009:75-683(-)